MAAQMFAGHTRLTSAWRGGLGITETADPPFRAVVPIPAERGDPAGGYERG